MDKPKIVNRVVFSELLLGLHSWDLVKNGVSAFNGVLVGTVISILYPGAILFDYG